MMNDYIYKGDLTMDELKACINNIQFNKNPKNFVIYGGSGFEDYLEVHWLIVRLDNIITTAREKEVLTNMIHSPDPEVVNLAREIITLKEQDNADFLTY